MLLLSETVKKRRVGKEFTECELCSFTFHRKFRKRKDVLQRGTSCELQDDALEKMFFHTPETRKAF